MRKTLIGLVLPLALGLPWAASAVTIDDFSTQQFVDLGFGEAGPESNTSGAPEAIGGDRTITLERNNFNPGGGTGLGTASADSSASDAGLFSHSNGANVNTTATISYEDLGGVSVVSGGEVFLRVIARSDLNATIRVEFGSDTDFSYAEIDVPGAGTGDGPLQVFDVPLASLLTEGLGGDLSALDEIRVIISSDNTSVDLQIDSISTFVPEPGSLALLGLGLGGLAVAGRRRAA